MAKNRSAIIWGVALLLVLSALACSFSGEVDWDRDSATAVPGGGGAAEATSPPATKVPEPAEVTEPPQATEVPAPAEPPAPDEPEPTATEAAPPPVEPPAGEDPLETADIPELEDPNLDPRGEGLGHVSTFRQHMRASFTEEGSDYTSVFEYDAEVNTGDQALHAIVSAEAAIPVLGLYDTHL
jgi:hypothetical protein